MFLSQACQCCPKSTVQFLKSTYVERRCTFKVKCTFKGVFLKSLCSARAQFLPSMDRWLRTEVAPLLNTNDPRPPRAAVAAAKSVIDDESNACASLTLLPRPQIRIYTLAFLLTLILNLIKLSLVIRKRRRVRRASIVRIQHITICQRKGEELQSRRPSFPQKL